MKFVLPVLVVVALLAAVLVRPPYIFLILGVLAVSAAMVFTYTGRVWVRFSGWVYRDKEAGWFWWEVALDYLIGVFFIGYFLYRVYEF